MGSRLLAIGSQCLSKGGCGLLSVSGARERAAAAGERSNRELRRIERGCFAIQLARKIRERTVNVVA
jgi:hypothetical protein